MLTRGQENQTHRDIKWKDIGAKGLLRLWYSEGELRVYIHIITYYTLHRLYRLCIYNSVCLMKFRNPF